MNEEIKKQKKVIYNKTYYEKHKSQIKHTITKIAKCKVCNLEFMRCNLYRHYKSKKHIMNKQKQDGIEYFI